MIRSSAKVSVGARPAANAGNVTTIWTIGHSVRPAAELIAVLKAHDVRTVADVRRTPFSRRHPQNSRDALERILAAAGIAYVHLPDLGGMREPTGSELNAGLRVSWMRGYADYMHTPGFEVGLAALIGLGNSARTAMMCAEADPARCHRSLVADALAARGIEVLHIRDAGPPDRHLGHPRARRAGSTVAYPSPQLAIEP
jgi:uncharacterized protein (DUF488 family)